MNAFFLAAKPRLNADLTEPLQGSVLLVIVVLLMQEVLVSFDPWDIDPRLWYFMEDLLWDASYLCALFSCDPNWRREVMKHKIFTVYDGKAQVYMQPFLMRADGEAIRAFRSSIAKAGHPFADYPADYTLFCIGEYDDDNGRFTQYDVFVNLGNGVQYTAEGLTYTSGHKDE